MVNSLKKLAKKVKVRSSGSTNDDSQLSSHHQHLLGKFKELKSSSNNNTTPTGFFAIYVGEERERFVVPISFLSHPLLKILLDKSYKEFGFQQKNGLVVPCSVSTFQEVLNAVECCNGRFQFGELVEEFL